MARSGAGTGVAARPDGALWSGAGAILSLSPSPDGRTLAFFVDRRQRVAHFSTQVRFLDLTTGSVDVRDTASDGVAWSLSYSPDGRTLAEARARHS